jgi:hypothetical protein
MMDKGSWAVLSLKIVLVAGAVIISLLSIFNKIPEWLIVFPAAPFVFLAIKRIMREY